MLDPEVKPSPAREMVHKGKGCLAVLLAAAMLAFGGYFVWDRTTGFVASLGEVPDYPGPGKGKVTVTVPTGSSLDVIGGILVDKDVVKSNRAWDQAVRSEERAQTVQAGSYIMKTQMRAIDALRLLINPGSSRIRSRFTVPEGLRLSAQIDVLAKGTKIKKSNFEAALKRPQTLGLPKYANNRPEGFLFPDTYELTAESTATSTMQQVLTVASIIEKEVNREEYRAKVARVIYNRLAKDMKLQMDSTVTYAENLKGTTTEKEHRLSRSPYNTYRYKGLPPGPNTTRTSSSSRPGARPTRAAVSADGVRRCAVLGSPIAHSLSPLLHRAA